ncbi:unnamed protein product [Phytophthora lilii]|uniref:Unnamed protein product n=1 Tax=Phytophthora lilii TaxID=2077276 RepID=A0A9W6X3N2_9STRA|nr:unnamed protein product [Phytophthora lilii]
MCQRVKPAGSAQAPLRPLPIATDTWRSVSMDFIFGLPPDDQGRTGVLVFVDRFSKMVHLAAVAAQVTAEETASLFLDCRSTSRRNTLTDGDGRTDRVFPSTDGIQTTAVTNLGANKLAPRFIGPFKMTQVIGDAYSLDIPKVMRLHPTFYVGRLKPYYPATIPTDVHPQQVLARSPSAQHDDADAGMARGLSPREMAPQREVRRRPASPNSAGDSSSPDAPIPTERRASQPRMPADHQSPQAVEPPARRRSPGRPPAASCDTGQSSNAPLRRSTRLHENKSSHEVRYRRDSPPPLVDAAGNERWIVESLVDHDLRRDREGGPHDARGRARRSEIYYRVRWLGHSPTEDTWEPRSRLLEDVPDVVNDYEASLAAASVTTVAANDYDPESAFDCANAGVTAILRGELCCWPELQLMLPFSARRSTPSLKAVRTAFHKVHSSQGLRSSSITKYAGVSVEFALELVVGIVFCVVAAWRDPATRVGDLHAVVGDSSAFALTGPLVLLREGGDVMGPIAYIGD